MYFPVNFGGGVGGRKLKRRKIRKLAFSLPRSFAGKKVWLLLVVLGI